MKLCKAFDTHNIPHIIFVSKLDRHGFDGRAAPWIRNCLVGCTHRVVVNGLTSKYRAVTKGISQGPVLRLALFNIFVTSGDRDSGTEVVYWWFTRLLFAFPFGDVGINEINPS